jgi:zinc transport system ATP-binding protein
VNSAIRLQNVCVQRDGASILENITADFPRGGVTAIIGPNGAGKSTLLAAMLGLIPSKGVIEFLPNGRTNGHARPRIGYVPQRLDFDREAPISVLDFLVMGQQRRPLWFGVRRKARETAVASLRNVQAEKLLNSPLGRLSGGELQRVQLALALQNDPDLVLLDEPVSGVDMAGEQLFCDLLEGIQREHAQGHGHRVTVVMVSHDLEVVSRHASQVLCLKKSVQFCGPPRQVLTSDNLVRAYGPHMGVCRHVLVDDPSSAVPVELRLPERPAQGIGRE